MRAGRTLTTAFGADTLTQVQSYEKTEITTLKTPSGEYCYYTRGDALILSDNRLYLEQSILQGASDGVCLSDDPLFRTLLPRAAGRKKSLGRPAPARNKPLCKVLLGGRNPPAGRTFPLGSGRTAHRQHLPARRGHLLHRRFDGLARFGTGRTKGQGPHAGQPLPFRYLPVSLPGYRRLGKIFYGLHPLPESLLAVSPVQPGRPYLRTVARGGTLAVFPPLGRDRPGRGADRERTRPQRADRDNRRAGGRTSPGNDRRFGGGAAREVQKYGHRTHRLQKHPLRPGYPCRSAPRAPPLRR